MSNNADPTIIKQVLDEFATKITEEYVMTLISGHKTLGTKPDHLLIGAIVENSVIEVNVKFTHHASKEDAIDQIVQMQNNCPDGIVNQVDLKQMISNSVKKCKS